MNVSKLKGLMAERGETQKDLAKILNISVQALQTKLKGKVDFKSSELEKIKNHYKVNVDYFF